jgi:hypothetical protein
MMLTGRCDRRKTYARLRFVIVVTRRVQATGSIAFSIVAQAQQRATKRAARPSATFAKLAKRKTSLIPSRQGHGGNPGRVGTLS